MRILQASVPTVTWITASSSSEVPVRNCTRPLEAVIAEAGWFRFSGFALVAPTGKALIWNMLGNGNWATAPTYAVSILTPYKEALTFSGVS
jgi:hypothetical protein